MPSIRAGDRHINASVSLGPWNAKYISEAYADLTMALGTEAIIEPIEPQTTWYTQSAFGTATPTNVPAIGRLNEWRGDGLNGGKVHDNPDGGVYGPGQTYLAAPVFEYGTPRGNVVSYTFSMDRQAQADYIYVPRAGYPEAGYAGAEVTKTSTDAAVVTNIGRLETWVDPGEISVAADRQNLADQHLALRKGPRRLVSFVPAVNNTVQPFVDYQVGNTVRFRAFLGSVLRFDLFVRIWSIDVDLDEAGNETVTLQTVENG